MANPQTEAKPAPATTNALTPADEIRQTIQSEAVKKQLLMVLPKQIPVERFQRIAITAVNKNSDLAICNRQSLYNAFMLAAQDGLLPDGREAAIVKFNSKNGPIATYMPMVGGILKKVRNSGELASITAQLVYKADVDTGRFRVWTDDNGEHIQHEPDVFGNRGRIVGAYAIAKTKDGAVYVELMTHEEIEQVRKVSRAANDGPWVDWWDQMAKKTVIRRLAKRLPMSSDLDDLIRRDDELVDLDAKRKGREESKTEGPSRLSSLIGSDATVVDAEHRPSEKTDLEPEVEYITVAQQQRLYAVAKGAGKTDEEVKDYLRESLKIDSASKVRVNQWGVVIGWAEDLATSKANQK